MASRFAAGHQDNSALEGVFFFASYPDQKGSLKDFKGKVLSIVGTKDGVLNQSSYDKSKTYLPQQTINVVLEGGNHAGFGSYGAQKGDNQADISNENNKKKLRQNSSSGSKLPKSKKNSLIRVLFLSVYSTAANGPKSILLFWTLTSITL